jgi:hypothetical protein
MKLSKNTLTILRNFAGINQSIYVVANERRLKTLRPVSKDIMAEAEIEESIPVSFGIYDLNEFLSALSLVPEPDFVFDPQRIEVSGDDGSKTLTYFCAAPEILVYPTMAIVDPQYDVSVRLTEASISSIKKAASVFGFETFRIVKEGDNSEVLCQVRDPKNASTNTYSVRLTEIDDDSSFAFDFQIESLKMIPGDYQIDISRKFISRWTQYGGHQSIRYWIALEKSSTYTESNS